MSKEEIKRKIHTDLCELEKRFTLPERYKFYNILESNIDLLTECHEPCDKILRVLEENGLIKKEDVTKTASESN
jgi:hypothetical protein